MVEKNNQIALPEQNMTDALKSWMMVALTLIFVFLYAAALIGWLKPLSDVTTIARLEPIIFVIIGYYFGRLPAQQNEKTLKDEITRQTQKADAAQQIKEKAQQERETLEEKVKNAKTALKASFTPHTSLQFSKQEDNSSKNLQNSAIDIAVNILDS